MDKTFAIGCMILLAAAAFRALDDLDCPMLSFLLIWAAETAICHAAGI